jgi:transcription elongation factor Elf1
MTPEEFLALCKSCGLSIADMDELEIGSAIDYLYDYIKLEKQKFGVAENGETEREATAEDMANF